MLSAARLRRGDRIVRVAEAGKHQMSRNYSSSCTTMRRMLTAVLFRLFLFIGQVTELRAMQLGNFAIEL